VLSPAVSWQLIGKLRRAFPQASVLIVEVDDEDLGMAYPGPVMRALRAGAHGYYVGESVTELGAFIRAKAEVRASASTPAPALEPGEEELDAVIEAIIRRQPATARQRDRD
jgi:DNA-binding NarL/FixJ family response regulator